MEHKKTGSRNRAGRLGCGIAVACSMAANTASSQAILDMRTAPAPRQPDATLSVPFIQKGTDLDRQSRDILARYGQAICRAALGRHGARCRTTPPSAIEDLTSLGPIGSGGQTGFAMSLSIARIARSNGIERSPRPMPSDPALESGVEPEDSEIGPIDLPVRTSPGVAATGEVIAGYRLNPVDASGPGGDITEEKIALIESVVKRWEKYESDQTHMTIETNSPGTDQTEIQKDND